MKLRRILTMLLSAAMLVGVIPGIHAAMAVPASTPKMTPVKGPIPNMGRTDAFIQLEATYKEVQANPIASEEEKVKNAVDSLFLADRESRKNGATMDTSFLFADTKSSDVGMYIYELGRTGLRVACDIYYNDSPLSYRYIPAYHSISIGETTATVVMTPATDLTYTDGEFPDVDGTHEIVLAKSAGAWKIVSNSYTDVISEQYAAGTDFASMIRDYRKTQDEYKANEKAYLDQTRGDFKANPRQAGAEEALGTDAGILSTLVMKDINTMLNYACLYTEQYDRNIPGDEWNPHTYNPLFLNFASSHNDCINYVNQCLWAAFGGVNDSSHIQSHSSPMVGSGSNQWWADSSSASTTWTSISSFRPMVKNNETGNLVGVHGADGTTTQLQAGDVALTSDYGHAMLIVQADVNHNGIVEFDEIVENSHTRNHLVAKVKDSIPGGESTAHWLLIYHCIK